MKSSDWTIWIWALGYFAAYVPYSALTKALTSGELGGYTPTGLEILPVTTVASLGGMYVSITALGWWKDAGRLSIGRWAVPVPGRWTFLSGLCTAAIIGTTTLAYSFAGASIVFMMLLMHRAARDPRGRAAPGRRAVREARPDGRIL